MEVFGVEEANVKGSGFKVFDQFLTPTSARWAR
jgi:hypothetical protein